MSAGALRALHSTVEAAPGLAAQLAGLDEGFLQVHLSNLLYMENPYSYKKCQ